MASSLLCLLLSLSRLAALGAGSGLHEAAPARVVAGAPTKPPAPPLDSSGHQVGLGSSNDEDAPSSNTTDSSNFILDNLVEQLVERVEAEVESRAPRRAPQLTPDDSIPDELGGAEGVPEEEEQHMQRRLQLQRHQHQLQAMRLMEADRRDQHIPYDTDQQPQTQPSLLQLQYLQASKRPAAQLQEEANTSLASPSEEPRSLAASQPQQVAIVVLDLAGGGNSSQAAGGANAEANHTASRNPYQARSMYQQQQQPLPQQPAKAPQHTRPPYASHDQFAPTPSSAVTSSGSNSSRTTQESSAVATLEQPPPLVGPSSGAATTVSNEPASGRANESSPASAFNNLNSRISGQLTQRNNQSPQLAERSGLAGGDGKLLDNKQVEGQLLQKLQPPNQMVELSPIPVGSQAEGQLRSGQQQADFYFPKDKQQQLRHQPTVALRGDRYPSVSLQEEDFMDSMASSSMHRYGGASGGEPGGAGGHVSSSSQELLESDLVPAGESPARGQQSFRPLAQAGFAASLINVTAPMVPPVSASEAMESALGVNQKVLLNQASGFIRNQGGSEAIVIKSGGGGGGSPQRHQAAANVNVGPYYSASSSPDAASYSQPANQFSPKQSHLAHLDQTDSQLATLINGSAAASQLDKDKMRLEPALGYGAGQQLQGRRPVQTPYVASAGVHNLSHTANPASSFRSPAHHLYHHQLAGHSQAPAQAWPSSYLTSGGPSVAAAAAAAPAAAGASPPASISNQSSAAFGQPQPPRAGGTQPPPIATSSSTSSPPSLATSTTNGFITQGSPAPSSLATTSQEPSSSAPLNAGPNRRQFNLTRVEHISAECSNDLIRTVIVFNGTFKGIIYSSGYVRDPNCMYINGTGKSRYDFSIRLNQCGTLGHQELRPPSGPNEVSRQDKVMWNTLSIQYNPIIEQEWDEHFRVSCEYGSDFWKTVSFSPFKVETNTGSPVMFTVDPPQCQMEILKGHGMVGPRQEAVSGPVTVGDPLTLLIHMKSEKAGYDILVKNCIAHNGGAQKMQLIDSNGCVVNERFISPFRGTYNDNDLKHVTLYSYLKAFRFTGSPVLYLECEIHMCQSKCPPQMCYWRRLSKRSANSSSWPADEDGEAPAGDSATGAATPRGSRTARRLELGHDAAAAITTSRPQQQQVAQMSDKVSLFQALEVRQEAPGARARALGEPDHQAAHLAAGDEGLAAGLVCYRRNQLLAYLLAGCSSLLAALGVALSCCWRVLRRRRRLGRHQQHQLMIKTMGLAGSPLGSASSCGLLTSSSSSSSSSSAIPPVVADEQLINYHKALASVAPILQHPHPHSRHKDHRPLAY